MPKRDPRITEAAQCRLDKQHAQFKKLYAQLLKNHKPTRLTQLISNEELRLQKAPV